MSSFILYDECVLPQNSRLPAILTPTLPPCLQSSAPLGTTTTPASIAVSAVPWAPISPTSVRTSAPAVQETQALTLMAPPVWPSARVCVRPGCGRRGGEAWEQWAWEEAGGGQGVNQQGAGLGSGWAGKSHPPSLPNPLNLKTGCWAGPCSTLSLERREAGSGEAGTGKVRLEGTKRAGRKGDPELGEEMMTKKEASYVYLISTSELFNFPNLFPH